MKPEKPIFSIKDHSPIQVASAMHSFSRDMQSYYKIIYGQLIDKLDQTTDETDLVTLKAELQEINQKIEYFHVLNNSVSIVSTILHSPLMIEEFRKSE